MPGQQGQQGQQAGQAVQQAQGQMSQAQGQLAQGQSQAAQGSMQQAAQALQQAAQMMAQQQAQGQPQPNVFAGLGGIGAPPPDPTIFGKDMKKYAGKPWGELPGELRTKIIQDMKAKYGEDYARIIKLYFEQLADTRKTNRSQPSGIRP